MIKEDDNGQIIVTELRPMSELDFVVDVLVNPRAFADLITGLRKTDDLVYIREGNLGD